MIKNKTLLMQLAFQVQLVLIGLTLWIVWQFVAGDIAHPIGFLSSVGAFPTEFDFLKPFTSVPTFGSQGLMSVFLWPMYYLSGVVVYLGISAMLVDRMMQCVEELCALVAPSFLE